MSHRFRLLMLALGAALLISAHGFALYAAWSYLAVPGVLAIAAFVVLKHAGLLDPFIRRLRQRVRHCWAD